MTLSTKTREEMANAVVKKAIKNGYSWMVDFKHLLFNDEDYWRYKNGREIFACLEEVLFEHKFAKAYWGYGKDLSDKYGSHWLFDGKEGALKRWQYHIQQAVISDDPLLYYFERL